MPSDSTPNQENPDKPPFGEDNDNAAATAFWICGVRALETRKPVEESKIRDPYAEELMCDWAWKQQVKTKTTMPFLYQGILHRTSYYDSMILKAASELNCRQCIFIGAGLDTRAFRLFDNYPDMHVMEVDHPNMFAYKEERMKKFKPKCKRTIIPLEYHEVTEWDSFAKKKAGFDPSKPTIFVLEGLTMYIPPKGEVELYEKVNANAAKGSMIMACNLKLLRTFGKPRKMENGITWYDTDRKGVESTMKDWGIFYKRLHWFDLPGIYLMLVGIKKTEEEYKKVQGQALQQKLAVVAVVVAMIVYLKG